jgi:hypothetical protein
MTKASYENRAKHGTSDTLNAVPRAGDCMRIREPNFCKNAGFNLGPLLFSQP